MKDYANIQAINPKILSDTQVITMVNDSVELLHAIYTNEYLYYGRKQKECYVKLKQFAQSIYDIRSYIIEHNLASNIAEANDFILTIYNTHYDTIISLLSLSQEKSYFIGATIARVASDGIPENWEDYE